MRTSSKKRAPDETLFSWLGNDSADDSVLMPSQELTWKLIQNHSIDIKATKLKVLSAKWVPEFPDLEWNNLLSRKVANLNTIFSGMYSMCTDN